MPLSLNAELQPNEGEKGAAGDRAEGVQSLPEDVRTACYHFNMVAEHGDDPRDEPTLGSINQKLAR